jgi:hypothetical protein
LSASNCLIELLVPAVAIYQRVFYTTAGTNALIY